MKYKAILVSYFLLQGFLSTSVGLAAIYTNQVYGAFRARIERVAARLETNPDFLVAIMALETAVQGTPTFDPSIENPVSGAVELIQFMPSTAVDLGTTTEKLKVMSSVEQLEFVEKYLSGLKGDVQKLTDLYLAVFYPRAIGKSDDFVFPHAVYRQNRGLDVNQDGKLEKREVGKRIKTFTTVVSDINRRFACLWFDLNVVHRM